MSLEEESPFGQAKRPAPQRQTSVAKVRERAPRRPLGNRAGPPR